MRWFLCLHGMVPVVFEIWRDVDPSCPYPIGGPVHSDTARVTMCFPQSPVTARDGRETAEGCHCCDATASRWEVAPLWRSKNVPVVYQHYGATTSTWECCTLYRTGTRYHEQPYRRMGLFLRTRQVPPVHSLPTTYRLSLLPQPKCTSYSTTVASSPHVRAVAVAITTEPETATVAEANTRRRSKNQLDRSIDIKKEMK